MLNVVVVCIGAVFFSFCFRISLIRTYAATFNLKYEHAKNKIYITSGAALQPFLVGE